MLLPDLSRSTGISKSRTITKELWAVETTLTQVSTSPKIWAFLAPSLIKTVRLLPYYKESKRGRSRKKQIQAALIVVGIICIAFGKSYFIGVGIFLSLIALFIPIQETRRRNWIVNLKTNSAKKIKSTHRISVRVETKKIFLSTDQFKIEFNKKKARRVYDQNKIYVGFRNAKTNSRIWFRAPSESSDWKGFEKNEKVDFVIDLSLEKVLELAHG